jgi:hypothetical protein
MLGSAAVSSVQAEVRAAMRAREMARRIRVFFQWEVSQQWTPCGRFG